MRWLSKIYLPLLLLTLVGMVLVGTDSPTMPEGLRALLLNFREQPASTRLPVGHDLAELDGKYVRAEGEEQIYFVLNSKRLAVWELPAGGTVIVVPEYVLELVPEFRGNWLSGESC